jgi:hypothetical protein
MNMQLYLAASLSSEATPRTLQRARTKGLPLSFPQSASVQREQSLSRWRVFRIACYKEIVLPGSRKALLKKG